MQKYKFVDINPKDLVPGKYYWRRLSGAFGGPKIWERVKFVGHTPLWFSGSGTIFHSGRNRMLVNLWDLKRRVKK